MDRFMEIMLRIKDLCDRADVREMPRVSISFVTMRDKAVFEAEVRREMASHATFKNFNTPDGAPYISEMNICGVKVRIL